MEMKNNAFEFESTLKDYLWKHIPISRAMGVKVNSASPEKVILEAPFTNNINHKKTAFGGSLHAVATLSCWSLLHVNLLELLKEPFQIVISNSKIEYLAPVSQDFKAECYKPDKDAWDYFLKMLNKKGKARLRLEAKIFQDDRLCVDYSGTFVAMKSQASNN